MAFVGFSAVPGSPIRTRAVEMLTVTILDVACTVKALGAGTKSIGDVVCVTCIASAVSVLLLARANTEPAVQ